MDSQSLQNFSFLSAAARYNTERRPLLRGYFSSALRSGQIFKKEVTDPEISDYWNSQGLSPDHPEKSFHQLLHIYPDDPDVQHYQLYLNIRYSDLSGQIRDKFGYSAVDLISLEALIHNLISERAENLGISSKYHTFDGKEEFIQSDKYERPSEVFQNKWLSCIEFSRSELIDEFLIKTENQPLSQHFTMSERIDTIHSMLKFLSTPYTDDVEHSQNQFLSTPLFEVDGKEDRILVPFPSLLVSTAQLRRSAERKTRRRISVGRPF